jgi:hypothetical protein
MRKVRLTGHRSLSSTELEAAHTIFERLEAVSGARRAAELLRVGSADTGAFIFSDICGSTDPELKGLSASIEVVTIAGRSAACERAPTRCALKQECGE